MSANAWLTLFVVVACMGTLVRSRISPDLVLAAGVVVLLVLGVLRPEQALAGLANEGLITVAAMYVVVAGVRETGGMDYLVRYLLGRPRGLYQARLRLMLPAALISAFLNNTPVVATFLPATLNWCRRIGLSPSRLLLPMSYATILGGTCTLIGTSTNLVVNGLWINHSAGPGLGLFELAWVGLPCALLGLTYLVLLGERLLPDRLPATASFANPREYTVEMVVAPQGPLVGRTVEQAGLRHLEGLYLVEIERDGRIIAAVGANERLQADDRLVFAGHIESVVELQRIQGLVPSAEPGFRLDARYPERCLIEVVVSSRCALLNETIAGGRFRTVYGASVIAVARDGKRIQGKLGNIRLQPADTLLLETRPVFLQRYRNAPDFLLVSHVDDSTPPRFDRAGIAGAILLVLVLLVGSGQLSMLLGALLAASAMLATGCCTASAARRNLDGQVLLAIAAAFGLGKALEVSGAAAHLAHSFIALAGDNPWLVLVAVYLLASVLTELVTNNAVAVLMFPIVVAVAESMGISPLPLVVTLMMAASASFATPIGYQTNLMVYGPGGYRFDDYLRAGIPLNLLCGTLTVVLVPWIWPF